MRHTLPCLLAAILTAGCATPRARPPETAPLSPDAAAAQAAASAPTLSAYMEAVRQLSRRARPETETALTVERWSKDLAVAIQQHAASPTADNEVALAAAYVRHGIADKAYEHFAAAARLDPAESAAWDGLARIWRDWRVPQFGLGDAYRAVHAAPGSPIVHNTLGTILQALGWGRDARVQFAAAVSLDPGAAYARNNLCYSWLMEGEAEAGSIECTQALELEPGLVPARNNLALARAMAGDLAGAAAIFGDVGGEAASQYNLGMVYLAQRRYSAAADAFDRAASLQPSPVLARARANQARGQEALEKGGSHERR